MDETTLGNSHSDGGKAQNYQRRDQQGQHGHHDLLALDLLAQVLWCTPHHQPGDEDRDDGKLEHTVEACANASKDDFTKRDIADQHHTSQWCIAIVEAHDRTRRGSRRGHFLEGRVVMPKRTSFPSMLPPACVVVTTWFAPTCNREDCRSARQE